MEENLARLSQFIGEYSNNNVIVTHTNPDADAIGSSLAWAAYLQKKGNAVTVITPNQVPSNLQWMQGFDDVIAFDTNSRTRKAGKDAIYNASVIYCLDFNSLQRIKELQDLVDKSPAKKVMIDHHLQPDDFADITFSDTNQAATAQYIFEIIEQLSDSELIDKNMSECMYAGIMTDTGSFRHGSTTPQVHQDVAKLMSFGLDVNKVHRLIFDQNPLSKTRLLGHVLSQNLVVLPEFRTAYMTISDEELRRFESNMGDTDGIVNYGLQIQDVVMAVLIIERKDEIKLSFRSIEAFSVRDLASKYFDGGGHKNASGGRTQLSINQTIEKILTILPEYQNELLNITK